jgi:hypothetical protein
MSVRPWLYHAICISLPRQPTADQGRTRPREVSQKSGAPFGRYSRLWTLQTCRRICAGALILRLASKLAQAKWDSVSSQIQHLALESNRPHARAELGTV